jgi:hypothetical protein
MSAVASTPSSLLSQLLGYDRMALEDLRKAKVIA